MDNFKFEDLFNGSKGQSSVINLATDLMKISVKAKEIATRCGKLMGE